MVFRQTLSWPCPPQESRLRRRAGCFYKQRGPVASAQNDVDT